MYELFSARRESYDRANGERRRPPRAFPQRRRSSFNAVGKSLRAHDYRLQIILSTHALLTFCTLHHLCLLYTSFFFVFTESKDKSIRFITLCITAMLVISDILDFIRSLLYRNKVSQLL